MKRPVFVVAMLLGFMFLAAATNSPRQELAASPGRESSSSKPQEPSSGEGDAVDNGATTEREKAATTNDSGNEEPWVEPIISPERFKSQIEFKTRLKNKPGNFEILLVVSQFMEGSWAKKPRLARAAYPFWLDDDYKFESISEFDDYVKKQEERFKAKGELPFNRLRESVLMINKVEIVSFSIDSKDLFGKEPKEKHVKPLAGRKGEIKAVAITSDFLSLETEDKVAENAKSLLLLEKVEGGTWKVFYAEFSY